MEKPIQESKDIHVQSELEEPIQELRQIHDEAEREVQAAYGELDAWIHQGKITEAEAESLSEHIERLSYWLSRFTDPVLREDYDAKWPRPDDNGDFGRGDPGVSEGGGVR